MVLNNFSHNLAECFLLRGEGITSVNVKVNTECHMSPGLWNFEQVSQNDCFGNKLACERTCPRVNIMYFILYLWFRASQIYFIINNQRDAALSRLIYYLLRDHSTCFGCSLHPSSGIHKTIVTTTGTSHVSV